MIFSGLVLYFNRLGAPSSTPTSTENQNTPPQGNRTSENTLTLKPWGGDEFHHPLGISYLQPKLFEMQFLDFSLHKVRHVKKH